MMHQFFYFSAVIFVYKVCHSLKKRKTKLLGAVFNAVSSGKATQKNITVLVNLNPHCFDNNIRSNGQFPRPLGNFKF